MIGGEKCKLVTLTHLHWLKEKVKVTRLSYDMEIFDKYQHETLT
jgi:hypothetical protein